MNWMLSSTLVPVPLVGTCLARPGMEVWSFQHGGDYEDRSDAPLFRGVGGGGFCLWIEVTDGFYPTRPTTARVGYQSYAHRSRSRSMATEISIYWKTAEFACEVCGNFMRVVWSTSSLFPAYRERERGKRRSELVD